METAIMGLLVFVMLLVMFFAGVWFGRRAERMDWKAVAFNNITQSGRDHIRCGGIDYVVMSMDQFFRDYRNPLAKQRMFEREMRRAIDREKGRANAS